MPGIDDTKEFVPLKIAVLTVSDTRDIKDDKSGAPLVQRIVAGRPLRRRAQHRHRRRRGNPRARQEPGSPIR